ncbi:metallophosphoesterase [Bacillus sp. 165]|uniref:metallophosphoesterase n=1 Tax=Bacillus sp. 165 TaxID=1529117 RepID=UPI001ADA4F3F|nr:metallophosphoesterase [Bacillus sp. 165]MBO9128271.1 metallophosphoesterase family protein [Bacillus sp. 165]
MSILLVVTVGGICGILLLLHMYREAFRNTVLEQDITFVDFPESFDRIVVFFISDIHKRKIAHEIVDKVKGKADVVIIGGDLLEKGVSMKRAADNIKMLTEIGPTYFVWGNNDYEVDYHELDALLLDYKVKILDNTGVLFESKEEEKLTILGVDDATLKRDRLDLALNDCEQEGFRILISHNPEIINKISAEDRVSLVLSGHTHGGQIRLLGVSPYLKGGVYLYPHTTLFVSNGYGTTKLPFRLGAPAQTHLITITRSS